MSDRTPRAPKGATQADAADTRAALGVSSRCPHPRANCAAGAPAPAAAFWADVAKAYEGGETIYSLAQRLGYHQTTIRKKLARFGFFADPNDSKPKQALKPAERKCLWCGRPFMSSWAGERKCKRCRSSDSEGAGAWR